MTFPTNNLPTQSRFWGREVEKKITNLEGSFKSAEVNNTTRDSQLSVTAGQALIAANQANAAAGQAGAAAIAANNALSGLISLGSDGSSYDIAAGNITAGTVTGLNIVGGTLSTSGNRHIEITATEAKFYDGDGTFSGRVTAEEDGRAATLYIGSSVSGVFMYNGGIELQANGPVEISGGNGLHSAGPISTDSDLTVGGSFSPASISTGSISSSSDITASGTISGNTISGSSVSASGTVSGSTVSGSTVSASNFSGTVNTSIAGNTTGSFTGNVFINTSGNMFRSTAGSSREIKDNIAPYDFDTDAFISVNPVTFNYKTEFLSNPEEAQISQLGFIVEDFEDAGLAEYLTVPANEVDNYKSLRYDKLYMYLHKVVQKQQETISGLTARIEALESR